MVTHLENFKNLIMLNTKATLAFFCLLLETEQEVHGAEVLRWCWVKGPDFCRSQELEWAKGRCTLTSSCFCACCQSPNPADSLHSYYKIDFVIKMPRKNREASIYIWCWVSFFYFLQWLWIKIHLMIILLKSWIRTRGKEVACYVFSLFSQRNQFLSLSLPLLMLFCPDGNDRRVCSPSATISLQVLFPRCEADNTPP